jgi:hypothetical protein
VKGKALDNEDAMPQSGSEVESGSARTAENDLEDEQAATGLGDMGASQSRGLGSAGSPTVEKDHAEVKSSQVLMLGGLDGGESSSLEGGQVLVKQAGKYLEDMGDSRSPVMSGGLNGEESSKSERDHILVQNPEEGRDVLATSPSQPLGERG